MSKDAALWRKAHETAARLSTYTRPPIRLVREWSRLVMAALETRQSNNAEGKT